MSAANKQSLEVSYAHLSQACPILAVWVADVPKQMFAMFNEVAHQVCAAVLLVCQCHNCWQWHIAERPASREDLADAVAQCICNTKLPAAEQVALEQLPDYGEIASEVFVRITDLPIQDSIRDLRCGSCRGSLCGGSRVGVIHLDRLPHIGSYTHHQTDRRMIFAFAGSIT